MTVNLMPMRRTNLAVMLIPVWLAMIGLMTVGLPGAVVLRAAMPLAGIVSSAQLGGDQVWPAALAISLLGPFALVPAHLLLRRACLPWWQHAVLASALALAVTLACSVAGIVLAGQ